MAFALSQQLLCLHSPKTSPSPPSKSHKLVGNPIFLVRLWPSHCKSSPQRNSSTSLQSSPPESEPDFSPELNGSPGDEPPSEPSLFDSISVRVRRLSDGIFKFDGLVSEILSIALPAALSLVADPISSLVDTAFVGHIGSAELAAVGVSVSVFNLIAKFFNVPLLNVTTSFVAEEQALVNKGDGYLSQFGDAAFIGVAETVALSLGSGFLMNTMGIPADSPMWEPAEQFLTLRAFGAPPIVIALAAQGTFRGFRDTKTPLYAIVAGNLVNAILDPILIFSFGLGIGGAAIATVISEYLIAFVLLWNLSDKISLVPAKIDERMISRYLTSGGLLVGRTIAVLGTTTLATSMAAREGPIRMAGFQICFEVWLAISLLNDALALAGQALLANSYAQRNPEQSRQVIYKVLQIGSVMGVGLAIILFVGFGAFSSLFTTDSEVLDVALSGLLFVAGSQPVNALAFVIDGLYYGVSDFEYAAYSMVIAGLISSLFMLVAAPSFGFAGIWTGLFLFMTVRIVAGFWRLGTKSGPWKMVWDTLEQETE
ncbi:protein DETOXIFICATION 44, chloroplastic isoform X2 [Morus notabilis]|uniref:protein DETOXIFICATION 44, chloroplastic isoform X2 n=1 Tax=Morus notabilis TaxID=981085 RepID=UPI000CECE680|nr:protein DETOXIFICATION 44, chloroplastic isoform X2 [Morus notabilis]